MLNRLFLMQDNATKSSLNSNKAPHKVVKAKQFNKLFRLYDWRETDWPIFVLALFVINVCGQEMNSTDSNRDSIHIGPCTWILDRKCPDKDVKFWLFTISNPNERQSIHVDETWEKSNLSSSLYDPRFPVKIIIHGYNSDMQLTPLIDMKQEYLERGNYNLIFADWSVLGPGPCEQDTWNFKYLETKYFQATLQQYITQNMWADASVNWCPEFERLETRTFI